MTDLSDPLLSDLSTFLLSNKFLSIRLFLDQLPLRLGASQQAALTEGEDYELIFVSSKEKKKEILSLGDISLIGSFFSNEENKIFDTKEIDLCHLYHKMIFKHRF